MDGPVPEDEASKRPGDGASMEFTDLGPFYFSIARHAYESLHKLKVPIQPRGITKEGKWTEASPHFRHAVTCIVFSAVAVEHELMRLIAIRIALQAGDDQSVRLAMGAWPERPGIDDMIRFLKSTTRIDAKLFSEVRTLFKDRNHLVHAGIKMERKDIEGPGGKQTWESRVDMPPLKPDIVETAKKDILIAGRAIKALRQAVTEPEWAAFRHRDRPDRDRR